MRNIFLTVHTYEGAVKRPSSTYVSNVATGRGFMEKTDKILD